MLKQYTEGQEKEEVWWCHPRIILPSTDTDPLPRYFFYLKLTPIYGHHGFVFLNFVDKPNRTIFLLIHTCYFVPFAIIVSRFFFFLVKVFIKPDGKKKTTFLCLLIYVDIFSCSALHYI